jgi:hypothetical protein
VIRTNGLLKKDNLFKNKTIISGYKNTIGGFLNGELIL